MSEHPVYFLPHHPVIKQDNKTTKSTVVFDGSMKTDKKVSLNDQMLNGPVVRKDLFENATLMRLQQRSLSPISTAFTLSQIINSIIARALN